MREAGRGSDTSTTRSSVVRAEQIARRYWPAADIVMKIGKKAARSRNKGGIQEKSQGIINLYPMYKSALV